MYSRDWVYFQIEPSNMTYVTRIMEGFEYVGVVTALDGKKVQVTSGPLRTRHLWPKTYCSTCPLK